MTFVLDRESLREKVRELAARRPEPGVDWVVHELLDTLSANECRNALGVTLGAFVDAVIRADDKAVLRARDQDIPADPNFSTRHATSGAHCLTAGGEPDIADSQTPRATHEADAVGEQSTPSGSQKSRDSHTRAVAAGGSTSPKVAAIRDAARSPWWQTTMRTKFVGVDEQHKWFGDCHPDDLEAGVVRREELAAGYLREAERWRTLAKLMRENSWHTVRDIPEGVLRQVLRGEAA